ncbi:hypothetical protein EV178_005277, partial [Coemansia sp. RSA 1646]
MPEYVESTSDIHFDFLRASKFHWPSWPKDLSTAGAITRANADGIIKLLNVHIVRMKNNSGVGIFVNMPHYVVDGTGLFTFVELWSKMCRAPTETLEDISAKFERGIIAQGLAAANVVGKPLDKAMVRVYTGFNPIADLLAWLSPRTRAWILDKCRISSGVSSATFRVSRLRLSQLCAQVQNYIDSVDNTHVLAALVSMVVAQAHKRNGTSRTNTIMSLNLLSDLRKSLNLNYQSYLGNGLVPFSAECPLSLLEAPINAESLAQATQFVSRIYNDVDAGLVASFIDMITTNPRSFM